MKKLFLLLFVNVLLFAVPNKLRNFTLVHSDNIRGDVKMIGNSVLEKYHNGWDTDQCPNQRTQNNHITAVYADKDNDPNTYNSTWAKLKLPAGVDSSNILYAYLYWQGRTKVNNNTTIQYGPKIKLKFYGFPNYKNITSIPEKFNYRYGDYQGVADVTELLKQSIDYVNNTVIATQGYEQPVWVADLYTKAGGSNLYGAWSLVVAYKDNNAHLKNITLYDGYDEIYNESKSYTLNGFLTPQRGVVNAKFMVFAGEGDVVYPDSISLTNPNGTPISLGNDFFHSSEDIDGVNILDREPNCQNTIGIDLRTVSVGTNANTPIIGNNQNSTTVTLSSNGDQYFPGVFIFSTDLYEPRICYYIDTIKDEDNTIVYENKHFVKDINPNKNYQISLWVSNMKKTASDEDIEIAKKVQVFLDTSDFNYTTSSTFIQNLGENSLSLKTDIKDSDTFEFNGTNGHTYRVGIGANSIEGGTIDVASSFNDNTKKAFIDFNGTFDLSDAQEINLDNIFHLKAAFATTSVTINKTEALPIPKCIDFDSSGSVFSPANGKFNVVNTNFTGNIDPLNQNDPKNALYTQIANQPFNVKVLSLKDDFKTLETFNGDVEIDLIPTPTYAQSDTDDIKTEKCKNAYTLTKKTITFADENQKNVNFIYPSINKDVTFRIVSFDYSGCNRESGFIARIRCMFKHFKNTIPSCANKCIKIYKTKDARKCMRCMFNNSNIDKNYICARDHFAIRPDHFKIIANGVNRADNNISFVTIKAFDKLNNIVTEYNISSLDLNMSAVDSSSLCASANVNYDFTFKNGIANVNYIKYPEVGNIQLQISEKVGNEFALVDQNDTSNSQRLIPMASSNTFSVLPDHFAIYNINAYNFNHANFTYLSKDLNMSGILSTIIEAHNANDQVTHNYSNVCYATQVDVNVSHSSNTPMTNLNNILTQYSSNQKDDDILFTLNENNFTNGQAVLNLKINFDRNSAAGYEVSPFTLTLNDINVMDENETNGSAIINQNMNFIYGRILTQDVATIENVANLKIIFQKFNGFEWVNNTEHDNKIYGDVNNTFTTSNVNIALNENTINNAEQNISLSPNINVRPYKVRLHLNIPTWLWYSMYGSNYVTPSNTNIDCFTHPCVNVLFLRKSEKGWGGIGTNEKENNVSKNTINSNIKQNTKKDIIFHKLTW